MIRSLILIRIIPRNAALDWQNNNSARASRFFVHFFVVAARLPRENSWFHVLWRTWTQDNDFLFLFLKLLYTLLEFNSRKNCQHLTNWTRWNKRDEVWNSATSLCKWRFRSRRRPCCLSSWLVSLSKYFFQRRTSTGSGLSALLSSGFCLDIRANSLYIIVKTLRSTNLVAWKPFQSRRPHPRLTCVAQKRLYLSA